MGSAPADTAGPGRFGHTGSLAMNKVVPVLQRARGGVPRKSAPSPAVMVALVPSPAPSLCAMHGHAMGQSRTLDPWRARFVYRACPR